MIGDISRAERIYIVCGYTDMRKAIDGLAAIVQQNYKLDVFSGSLFLFCGKRCDRIKALLWERLGYILSRTTMANWIIRCSEDYFSKLVQCLKEEMLKEDILHIDETYVRVLKEQGVSQNSKQYMWVYRTGKHCQKQIVIYRYDKSRSGDVPQKYLGEYDGYIHTDGYAGYNKLTKVTHCNCWAHLRRKFHEAIVWKHEVPSLSVGINASAENENPHFRPILLKCIRLIKRHP